MPGVTRSASLSFPLRVPGEGLPSNVGCRLVKGVPNSSPASLKDVVYYRLPSCSLRRYLVADGVQPGNLENPSKIGVDECLDSLHGGDSGSPGLSSIK